MSDQELARGSWLSDNLSELEDASAAGQEDEERCNQRSSSQHCNSSSQDRRWKRTSRERRCNTAGQARTVPTLNVDTPVRGDTDSVKDRASVKRQTIDHHPQRMAKSALTSTECLTNRITSRSHSRLMTERIGSWQICEAYAKPFFSVPQ